MAQKKKIRNKKYKPRQVNIPPFLLKQELGKDVIAKFERRMRDIYLQFHLETADIKALYDLTRHFLLGAAVREKFVEEEAIFTEAVKATEVCIDNIIALKEGKPLDWQSLCETEPTANLVIELISQGEALDALVEMEWLNQESDKIILDLIETRKKDLSTNND